MFNFAWENIAIITAVDLANGFIFRVARIARKVFKSLAAIFSIIFLFGFVLQVISQITSRRLLGAFLVSFVFYLFFFLVEMFLQGKLAKPRLKTDIKTALASLDKTNAVEYLSLASAAALVKTVRFAKAKKTTADSLLLLYFLLVDNKQLNFIFRRALLDLEKIKKQLKGKIDDLPVNNEELRYSPALENTLDAALRISAEKGHERIEIGDLLCALAKADAAFKEILIESRLRPSDVGSLVSWLEFLERKVREGKLFWEKKNLTRLGSLAKEWTAGYSISLDRFSMDLTETIRLAGYPGTIGHEKAIAEMERILARKERNGVLIVGEPGSGRKSMVMALARKCGLGETLPGVNYKRVVELDLAALIAQAGNPGESEALVLKVLDEVAYAGNIILVIDEFHNFVGQTAKMGTVDISGLLSAYLAKSKIQLVAITSYEGLHRRIELNSSFLSLLEKIEVQEISEKETMMLLENLSLVLENRYRKFITFPALRDIISYCGRYMPATPFPEKALNLLQELLVYVAQTKEPMVLPQHVAKIVFEKTQIPVGDIETKEKEKLLNLENLIHERIINQEEAVKEIANAMRRARAEVTSRKGPIGTFLFLGPTGVGKTETAKALAEIYFGSEERMIRLDMSEFQNTSDINRLLGSPGEEGLLTTKVRETPFSLVLLDELEKAHPNILNLFLQVLDDGHLTDGLGRKIDFKDTIIIATSNAGYELILEALKQTDGWDNIKERLIDYLFVNAQFRPEFINRFDAVVVFKPLTKENLLDIAGLMFDKIKKGLQQKDMEFVYSPALAEKIVELAYNPMFGAREMKRVIQDKVENALAKAILSGKVKRGGRIEVLAEDFSVKIR